MRARNVAIVVIIFLAGCAHASKNDAQSTETQITTEQEAVPEGDTATSSSDPPSVSATTEADGSHLVTVEGRLDGQGLWLGWMFEEPRSTYSVASDLQVSCGRLLFVPPALLSLDENQTHFVFEPDITIVSERAQAAYAASSSASSFQGSVTGVVADGKACLRYTVKFPKDVDAQVEVARFNATWSVHGPYNVDQGRFEMPVQRPGWTHVQRVAACGTPIPSPPTHLIAATLAFPNGMVLKAGPYLNGIFPGPTVDDAAYFGVWRDAPGNVQVDLKAPTPECLVVVDTDFQPTWATPGSGYVDRWWRQEPVYP